MIWECFIVYMREQLEAPGRVQSREWTKQTEHGQGYLWEMGEEQEINNRESIVRVVGAGAETTETAKLSEGWIGKEACELQGV